MNTIQKLISFLTLSLLIALNINSQSGWVQQNSGTNGNLGYVDAVNQNIVFTGNPSLKTTNGGSTWLPNSLPSASSMDMLNANTGYAVNNDAYKTTNGGANWTIVSPSAPLYYHCSFINEQTGYIGGIQDMYFLDAWKTTNAGVNWSVVNVYYCDEWPNEMTFYEIEAISTNVIYISYRVFYEYWPGPGYYLMNYMQKSTNGGTSFSTMMQSEHGGFYNMSFPSANTGYLHASLGSQNLIYKSVNDNWGTTISLSTSYFISKIEFPSVDTGFAICNAGVIYKTTNAGVNWFTMNSGVTTTLRGIKFINNLTGWIVGDNGVILKTTTGGETPVLNSVSGFVRYQDNNEPVTSGYVRAIRYDSVSYGIVAVDSAQIQPNGSYTLANCPPVTLDIMAYENDEEELSFVPTYYVSTIYWENAVHVKPDSNLANINIGVKRIVNPGGNLHIGGFVYSNSQIDYVALKDAVIYSRSAGIFKSHSISVANGSYRVDSLQPGVYELIADRMGYDGQSYVVSLTNSSLENINFYLDNVLLPVNDPGANIPENYSLEQNFPNPFNPVTKIRFAVPSSETSNIELFIYDILGRQIAKLVDSQLEPGTYEVQWDGTNYPSGVYFYSMEANGFKDTKKMVLLK